MGRLVALYVSFVIVGWKCAGQTLKYGTVLLNNYDANQPILFFDGVTNQLAPVRTLVQVLARPLGSSAEFQVLPYRTATNVTAFYVDPPGFFDAGYVFVPGVKEFDRAEFIVRAWRVAQTWVEALTNAFAVVGHSPIFTNLTGRGPNDVELAIPAPLYNFPSFTIYPFPEACHLVPFVGPKPLCMDASANAQSLSFTWADLGTNYVYTLESKPSLTATNWMPVAGATWPARTNQFTLSNPVAAPRFYRVKAQAIQ